MDPKNVKLPEWMRSDYQWVWNGELMRFAMITAAGAAVVLATDALSIASATDSWWVAPLAAGGSQLIDYVRGRLPEKPVDNTKSVDSEFRQW